MSLATYMLIATIAIVVFGLLLGLLRGSRRSVLRLLLVLLCVVGAYFLKDVITSALLKVQIQGSTIEQFITNLLPEDIRSMSEVAMPLVNTILSVLSFLLGFAVLQLLSWAILFPILKIFVKKGKKKHALVGGLVGAVQGVAVAFVICVVLNGLFVNVGNVMAAMDESESGGAETVAIVATADESGAATDETGGSVTDGTQTDGEGNGGGGGGSKTDMLDNFYALLKSYPDSKISQMYDKIGGKAFNLVSTVKMQDQDGNEQKYTLKGQTDAVLSMLKLAKRAEVFQNIQVQGGIADCGESIKAVFDLLDEVTKDLSVESQEMMNTMLNKAAEVLIPDLPVDVSVIDFTKADFAHEGEIIVNLTSYAKKTDSITAEDAKNIVDNVMESDIIIPLLSSAVDNLDLKLSEDQKSAAQNVIAQYEADENYNAEKLAQVKAFLGLNDMGA